MKKFLFLVLLSFPVLAFAQQAVGHLTIFSEDGDNFFLILNGEKQNNVPQTNLRVEDLPQPYYSVKIIFADSVMAPISKKNLQLTDASGTMMDVTYRIKKDKAGKTKLTPYSAIAVQPDFVPPAGTSVYHYGNPGGTVTTTTTTTEGANANINVNGMSMTIKVDDPIELGSTTTTKTTRTTHTTNGNYEENTSSNCWPMKGSDFSSAKNTISSTSFEDSKLSTAKSILASNCLNTDQVVEICRLFDFEQTKLTFAKLAYKKTTDQKNYFKVNNVFDFDASKQELSTFIGEQ